LFCFNWLFDFTNIFLKKSIWPTAPAYESIYQLFWCQN
jgi:hypothetical protein